MSHAYVPVKLDDKSSTKQPNSKPTYQSGGNNTDFYRYKAEKYHTKIQAKLKTMIQNGQSCPAGYEQYLQPFRG